MTARVIVAAVLLLASALAQAPTKRGWSLNIKAVSDRGVPLSGARVVLSFYDSSRVMGASMTDSNGDATIRIDTIKPLSLRGLNLLAYGEIHGLPPTLVILDGSPDATVSMQFAEGLSSRWARKMAEVLKKLPGAVLALPVRNHFLPVEAVFRNSPCKAMPLGVPCYESPLVTRPTIAINGKVAFGEFKGRRIDDLLTNHR